MQFEAGAAAPPPPDAAPADVAPPGAAPPPPAPPPPSVLAWRGGIPEVRPLATAAELLAWRPSAEEAAYARAGGALPPPPPPSPPAALNKAPRPRLLAAHDMRGNYLEDRLCQGGADADAYLFRHWRDIDIFVYFSHTLVTVPPPGWATAGHAAGVPVLGTLIAEWAAGAAAMAALLATDAAADAAADQLAALARHLSFDGWLVNVECELEPALVPRLLRLLRRLTAAVRAANPSGVVLWYDAVTTEGELKWQNALNDLNEPFFDACDGIWLNYGWKEGELKCFAARAGARAADVFVGVDVFGRGTPGGGGLASGAAAAAAAAAGCSAALFAIGRAFEDVGAEVTRWRGADDAFWAATRGAWRGDAPPARPDVRALPFSSAFCAGAGRRYAGGGAPLSSAPWYCLSLQSPQPALEARQPGDGGRVEAAPTLDDAFAGGGAVRLAGALVAAPARVRLFTAAAAVPPAGLAARLVAALLVGGAGVGLRLRLVLRARGGGGDASEWNLDLAPGGAAAAGAAPAPPCVWLPPAAPPASASRPPAGAAEWATWRWRVDAAALAAAAAAAGARGGAAGWELAALDVLAVRAEIHGSAEPAEFEALLGGVSLEPLPPAGAAAAPPPPPVEALRCEHAAVESGPVPGGGGARAAFLSCRLRWCFPPGVARLHVWAAAAAPGGGWGAPRFLGAACQPAFCVAALPLAPGARAAARFAVAAAGELDAQALAAAAAVEVEASY
jgi:mannosyl-glycoprotein endo-beta-N-acetylglucosaminidase